jgi:hypothetical protein
MVPKDLEARPDRSKVAWVAQFYHSAGVRAPVCEGLARKEAVYFVHRHPESEWYFDGRVETRLKPLRKVGGRQSPDSERFSCRQSDSLRGLRARLLVCSITKRSACLISTVRLEETNVAGGNERGESESDRGDPGDFLRGLAILAAPFQVQSGKDD